MLLQKAHQRGISLNELQFGQVKRIDLGTLSFERAFNNTANMTE